MGTEGNTKVSIAGLAGPIHLTPHDSYIDVGIDVGSLFLELLDNLSEIYPASAAGRAGDDVYTTFSQTHTPKDMIGRYHFVHRIARQRDPYGIAYAFMKEDAYPDCRLDGTRKYGACLRDPHMKRVVGKL